MSERSGPAPSFVYDEAINLETFSVYRKMRLIIADVIYVPDETPIPRDGQFVEVRVLGTSVRGMVKNVSEMRDGNLHIQAMRLQE